MHDYKKIVQRFTFQRLRWAVTVGRGGAYAITGTVLSILTSDGSNNRNCDTTTCCSTTAFATATAIFFFNNRADIFI